MQMKNVPGCPHWNHLAHPNTARNQFGYYRTCHRLHSHVLRHLRFHKTSPGSGQSRRMRHHSQPSLRLSRGKNWTATIVGKTAEPADSEQAATTTNLYLTKKLGYLRVTTQCSTVLENPWVNSRPYNVINDIFESVHKCCGPLSSLLSSSSLPVLHFSLPFPFTHLCSSFPSPFSSLLYSPLPSLPNLESAFP